MDKFAFEIVISIVSKS